MDSTKVLIPDEYEDYDDFSALTKKDFDLLDSQMISKGRPHVEIEIESHANRDESNVTRSSSSSATADKRNGDGDRSPLAMFRAKKPYISVSDIVGPSWCEVQFDYGLRGKRNVALEKRPQSFETKSGKTIVVEKKLSEQRELHLDKGKAVHKKLEREIRPVEVEVKTSTKEEMWALHLLNILDCLDSLVHLGRAREMPVLGIIKGRVIFGVIDEIVRTARPINRRKRPVRSAPSTPQKTKRVRQRTEPVQTGSSTSLANEIPVGESQKAFTTAQGQDPSQFSLLTRRHKLHLHDFKTRHTRTVPDDDATLQSRLQLMLYHRLLSRMLFDLDFSVIWQKMDIDPTRKFSKNFMSQTMLADNVRCIDHIFNSGMWHDAIKNVDAAYVDKQLTLIYHDGTQSTKKKQKSKENRELIHPRESADIAKAIKESIKDMGNASEQTLQEQADIARVIEASLADSKTAVDEATASGQLPDANGPVVGQADREGRTIAAGRNLVTSNTQMQSELPSTSKSPTVDEEEMNMAIIGVKVFNNDERFVEEYLKDVLDWWEGRREPRGVELKDVWRCSKCEYRNGCEWREKKHMERRERKASDNRIGMEPTLVDLEGPITPNDLSEAGNVFR